MAIVLLAALLAPCLSTAAAAAEFDCLDHADEWSAEKREWCQNKGVKVLKLKDHAEQAKPASGDSTEAGGLEVLKPSDQAAKSLPPGERFSAGAPPNAAPLQDRFDCLDLHSPWSVSKADWCRKQKGVKVLKASSSPAQAFDCAAGHDKAGKDAEGCVDPSVAESCEKAVHWAMSVGIFAHPEWYSNLTHYSSFAQFQKHLSLIDEAKCTKPCASERTYADLGEFLHAKKAWCALHHGVKPAEDHKQHESQKGGKKQDEKQLAQKVQEKLEAEQAEKRKVEEEKRKKEEENKETEQEEAKQKEKHEDDDRKTQEAEKKAEEEKGAAPQKNKEEDQKKQEAEEEAKESTNHKDNHEKATDAAGAAAKLSPDSKPKTCVEEGVAYYPLDMLGHALIVESSAEACRARCASVDGCVHYSFWAMVGSCHLQDENAQPFANQAGVVSGPPRCEAEKAAPSQKSSDAGCFTEGSTYFPDILGVLPEYVKTVELCQEKCRGDSTCAHFTYEKPTGLCRLQDSSASRVDTVLPSVTGPRKCPGADALMVKFSGPAGLAIGPAAAGLPALLVAAAALVSAALAGALTLARRRSAGARRAGTGRYEPLEALGSAALAQV